MRASGVARSISPKIASAHPSGRKGRMRQLRVSRQRRAGRACERGAADVALRGEQHAQHVAAVRRRCASSERACSCAQRRTHAPGPPCAPLLLAHEGRGAVDGHHGVVAPYVRRMRRPAANGPPPVSAAVPLQACERMSAAPLVAQRGARGAPGPRLRRLRRAVARFVSVLQPTQPAQPGCGALTGGAMGARRPERASRSRTGACVGASWT
jgi:hypothetical protein